VVACDERGIKQTFWAVGPEVSRNGLGEISGDLLEADFEGVNEIALGPLRHAYPGE